MYICVLTLLPVSPWLFFRKQWEDTAHSLSQWDRGPPCLSLWCRLWCLTDTMTSFVMTTKSWEQWNAGSAINWGQVEMIYDPRNALTPDTIIQTTVSTELRNQIQVGISRKWEIAQRDLKGEAEWGQMRPDLGCRAFTFSSQTVNQPPGPDLSRFRDAASSGSTPGKFHLSGIQQEKRGLEVSEEGGIWAGCSASVCTPQLAPVSSRLPEQPCQMCFPSLGNLELDPKIAVQCSPLCRILQWVPRAPAQHPCSTALFSLRAWEKEHRKAALFSNPRHSDSLQRLNVYSEITNWLHFILISFIYIYM